MNEAIELDQITDLAEYMGMRLTNNQATMWLKDFKSENISKKDFQYFSNWWRKNKDVAFKPKNVLEFLGMAGIKNQSNTQSDRKYCYKCNYTGWAFLKLPPNFVGNAFRCICNNDQTVQHLETIESFLNSDFYKENHGLIVRL